MTLASWRTRELALQKYSLGPYCLRSFIGHRDKIKAALHKADLILTTGGSSMGSILTIQHEAYKVLTVLQAPATCSSR